MPVAPTGGASVTYRQQYRRCGKLACTVCSGGGAGHGPYWYATWHEGGRSHTRYLGKALPPTGGPGGNDGTPAATSPADRQAFRVRTLGGFAVWREGTALPSSAWAGQRAGTLFKWLLAAPGHRLSRDRASELLWPDVAPNAGAANLRVLIHRLRRALGEASQAPASAIAFDGETLALLPGDRAADWLDAAAFERGAERALAGHDRAACRAALAIYTGDYLPEDPYDEWALARRDTLSQMRVRLLLHLAGLDRAAGEAEAAIGCLHEVLAADRCHEEAALLLVSLHADAGHVGAALRVYRQLVDALREELDLAPGTKARALAATLRARQEAVSLAPAVLSTPNNLPAAMTSFIGRGRDLAELRALLGPGRAAHESGVADRPGPGCRLLTLVGPGGAGKTRLALALAEDLLEAYPDGIWLVELSGLPASAVESDPLIAQAAAAALGVREEPTRSAVTALIDHLKGRRALLLLDNCEHVLPACATLAAALLPTCSALRILATSRETLGVAGEQPWSVRMLSLPNGTDPARLVEAEAVRLFLARARVHRPGLEVTAENAAALASICRQLDGLPLALELAAARAGMLSLEGIAARLGESLRVLIGGPRTVPARQRTLRATLDWSYGLLDDKERSLLRRLAVFAGGATLEAIEAVGVGADGDAPPAQPAEGTDTLLDALAGLARKSLLLVEEQPDGVRYRLLETVRQYGAERLSADDDEVGARERHAGYLADLGERADPHLVGHQQALWLARLDHELDNIRTALEWLPTTGRITLGLRLATAVWRFWHIRGHLREGCRYLESLLRRVSEQDWDAAPLRARALYALGGLAFEQDDNARAIGFSRAALALYRELGDATGMARALSGLAAVTQASGDLNGARRWHEEGLALHRAAGNMNAVASTLYNLAEVARSQGDHQRAAPLYDEAIVLYRELGSKRHLLIALRSLGLMTLTWGDWSRADALFAESLATARELGDERGIAWALEGQGSAARARGDYVRAWALLDESLTRQREIDDRSGMSDTLNALATLALAQGDCARATAFAQESLQLRRDGDNKHGVAYVLLTLAEIARAEGDAERACSLYREGLALFRPTGDTRGAVLCLEGLATVARATGQAAVGARLAGAAIALRRTHAIDPAPHWRATQDRLTADLRDALGTEVFAAHWAAGEALALDEVIALALGEC